MRPKDLFKMVEVKIDLEKCGGCGTCVDICPTVYDVRTGSQPFSMLITASLAWFV